MLSLKVVVLYIWDIGQCPVYCNIIASYASGDGALDMDLAQETTNNSPDRPQTSPLHVVPLLLFRILGRIPMLVNP